MRASSRNWADARFDLVLATADSTSRNTCESPAIRRIAENAVARSSSALAT
jgi:hypothetical protein